MPGLRARIAKKAAKVMRAQAVPPAPAAPAPAAPPGQGMAPPPSPAPNLPRPPGRPPAGGTPPMPSGAPGAPGAPGVGKPKEEIEQNVEKDIRKEKEQEKKIDDLDEKVTSIGDQIEGLTKSINGLVNTVQKGIGMPTDFEKKIDELKDKEEDGLSSSEFGLGNSDDSLIVSKEGHVMSIDKKKLRNAREQRLAKQQVAKELTFEMKEMPNKKYKQQVPPPTITKLKDEPADWGQYRLKASDMAMDLNASGDEWAVVNKHTDQVFYTLQPTAETKDVFPTREFAEAVINDVREMGLEAAMKKYSALPMEFLKKKEEEPAALPEKKDDMKKEKLHLKPKPKMTMKPEKKMPPFLQKKKEEELPEKKELEEEACGAVAKEAQLENPEEEVVEQNAPDQEAASEAEVIDQEAADAGEEEVATVTEPEKPTEATASLADVRRRFIRAFRLALSAQQKNLADNPLKAAWFATLSHLDIPNPEKVIEATFAKAAAEHFEVALLKTAEFLDLSAEAFIEMEAQIGELNTQPPRTIEEVEEDTQHAKAAAMRLRAHTASLPLSSASADDPAATYAAQLQNALPRPKLHGVEKLM